MFNIRVGDVVVIAQNASREALLPARGYPINELRGRAFTVTRSSFLGNPVLDTSRVGLSGPQPDQWVVHPDAVQEVQTNRRPSEGDYIRIRSAANAHDLICHPDQVYWFPDRVMRINEVRDHGGDYMLLLSIPNTGFTWRARPSVVGAVVNPDYASWLLDQNAVTTGECEDCGQESANLNRIGGGVGYFVCNGCFDRYFYCEGCGEYLDESHATVEDDAYCAECFDERFTICDRCRETVPVEDTSSDFFGDPICDGCNEEDEDMPGSENIILPYHAENPVELFGRGRRNVAQSGSKFYFGIEMEYEIKDGFDLMRTARRVKDLVDGRAFLMEDGSLRQGFEIVTRPESQGEIKELFGRLFEERLTTNLGLKVNNHTGLHINISKSGFDNNLSMAIANVVCNNFPDFINQITGRSSGEWAAQMHKNMDRASREAREGAVPRHSAINLGNRHRAEVRMFKATTHPRKFVERLMLARFLVDYSNYCAAQGIQPGVNSMQAKINTDDRYVDLRRYTDSEVMEVEEQSLPREFRPARSA